MTALDNEISLVKIRMVEIATLSNSNGNVVEQTSEQG